MTMRITQGTTGRRTWEVTADTGLPITDWTGWVATAQARATAAAADVLFEWSTAAGTIELVPAVVGEDDTTPAYLRLLTPADVSLEWEWTAAEFDVRLTDPSGVLVARTPTDKIVVAAAVTHAP